MDGTAPQKSPDKKLHILTWGCQMNEYDSGRMADLLAPLGYGLCATPEESDLVILNTCHIREKATEKIFSELGRLRLKQQDQENQGRKMMIAVAGCVAQAEGREIRRRAPYVDLVFGPQTYHRLPEMITQALRGTGGVVNTDFPAESKFDFLPEESRPRGASAFLSIQEGCDKFCTFCVVPYTRGAEVSRPAAAILEEARRLLGSGVRELVLLGQNVNAWHGEGTDGKTWSLARLLRAVAELPGILRLRYTTSHPRNMDDDLIQAHGELPQLCPFLHLPVQSGSDQILRTMNRGHSREDYLRIIARLRKICPDIAFSSDFITGFPGETEQDFEDTLALVQEVNYAQAFSFKYSPRPGTPAALMAGQVPEEIKAKRLEILQELLFKQQQAFNQHWVGKRLPVLIEGQGRKPGQLYGRSPYMQAVHIRGAKMPSGSLAEVVINQGLFNNLEGRMCGSY